MAINRKFTSDINGGAGFRTLDVRDSATGRGLVFSLTDGTTGNARLSDARVEELRDALTAYLDGKQAPAPLGLAGFLGASPTLSIRDEVRDWSAAGTTTGPFTTPRFRSGDRVKIGARPRNRYWPAPAGFANAEATVTNGPDTDGDYWVTLSDGRESYVAASHLTKIEAPAAKFETGDRVRVKTGLFAGSVGTVGTPENRYGNVVIRIGRTDKVIRARDLEAAPAPTFEVGDRVRVGSAPRTTLRGGQTGYVDQAIAGKTGRVVRAAASTGYLAGNPRVEADGISQWIGPEYLTKIGAEEAPALAVGDLVRIGSRPKAADGGRVHACYWGALGKIDEGLDSDGDYFVELIETACTGCGTDDRPEYQYIAASHLAKEAPRPFAVGDRIALTEEGAQFKSAEAGAEAIVTQIPGSSSAFLQLRWDRTDVRVKGQVDGNYLPRSFEHAPARPKLAAGDRVRISETATMADGCEIDDEYLGEVGIIESGPDSDGDYAVRCDAAGDWCYIGADSLTKIEEEKPKALAVGDRVRISATPKTSDGGGVNPHYAEGVGEVVAGPYLLEGDKDRFVRLVDASPFAPADSMTWNRAHQKIAVEQLTKVEEPAPTVLTSGDVVLVGDQPRNVMGGRVFLGFAGKVGKVVGGLTALGNRFVEVDGQTDRIDPKHLTKVTPIFRGASVPVGARVVVLDADGSSRARLHATGRVTGNGYTSSPISGRRVLDVKLDGGATVGMYSDRFGLLAE